MDENKEIPPEDRQLDDREQIFADEYLLCLEKKSAALKAGCPENASRQQGYEIYNRPHVKAYIAHKLKERTITVEETIKLISDTAQSTVTDYMRPVMVPFTPKIKVPLADIISEREEYVLREIEFCDRIGLEGDEFDSFRANLQQTKNSIIRLQIELERDPDAYRIIDGETVLVEELQLDMTALTADKEKGKVKKIKQSKDGSIEIEMYSASDAQDKLMKMFGKYAPIKTATTTVTGEDVNQPAAITINPQLTTAPTDNEGQDSQDGQISIKESE